MSNNDYPEPFEVSSARHMENIARFHAREQMRLQANAPAAAQPERAQRPTYNSPPQAQRAQPGYNNGPRQVRVQQAPTGGYGYGQPATQAQQGEYGYDQHHSYSPSPSPDFSPEPPSAPYTQPSGRPKGHGTRTREIIYLEPGFAWNRESLALLYKIKERSKKGFKLIASKGKFPGKTEKELQDTWTARKVEAKVYYEEVYGKPGQK